MPGKPTQQDEDEVEVEGDVEDNEVEGEVEEGGRDVARRDQDGDDDRGSSDQPPTRKDIESWYQRQDDAERTDTSATLAPLANASAEDWLGTNKDPDVLLSIPNLGVDHIGLEVDNLRAHVELHAKVLDLLELDIGADVSIEKVELNIENVRVQAMLKVRLENVVQIVNRVMDTIDANPEILTNLTAGLGKGLETGLGQKNAVELEKQPGRLKGVESSDEESEDEAGDESGQRKKKE
jgi:hypothetical protein